METWRGYARLIQHAIDVSRPAGEQWFVTTSQKVDSKVIRFDFALGIEAPHSLAFEPMHDDADDSVLYRTVCQFLRTT